MAVATDVEEKVNKHGQKKERNGIVEEIVHYANRLGIPFLVGLWWLWMGDDVQRGLRRDPDTHVRIESHLI